jgi:hypothetical protein
MSWILLLSSSTSFTGGRLKDGLDLLLSSSTSFTGPSEGLFVYLPECRLLDDPYRWWPVLSLDFIPEGLALMYF